LCIAKFVDALQLGDAIDQATNALPKVFIKIGQVKIGIFGYIVEQPRC
jgi:hypothetical protein